MPRSSVSSCGPKTTDALLTGRNAAVPIFSLNVSTEAASPAPEQWVHWPIRLEQFCDRKSRPDRLPVPGEGSIHAGLKTCWYALVPSTKLRTGRVSRERLTLTALRGSIYWLECDPWE